MAKTPSTGPSKTGEVWREATGTCNVCSNSYGIGKMVKIGESENVTDPCINPLCEGTATVTLNG